MNIKRLISEKIYQSLIKSGVNVNCELQVRQSTKAEFGDYQVDGMMAIAKKLGISTQLLIKKLINNLNLSTIANKIEVVNPGFINIFLDHAFLVHNIDIALRSKRLGIKKHKAQTVVVDYSSPNVAKEMHIGHLRSTIIGDATVRTLEFFGHNVIRANHIGDWGTQFGMLIAYLKNQQLNLSKMTLKDLEYCYKQANEKYISDKSFAIAARNYVVKLQNKDSSLIEIWRKLVDITMSQNQIIYDRLNITLNNDNIMGESLYSSMLSSVVEDLKLKKLAVESEGAIVVFLNEFKNKNGKPMGVIIQKKDGGYLYTTTDIACIKYRCEKLHADRIIYYVDSRQNQHLMQVWTIARKAKYIPNSVSVEHHMFGMMLNKHGKPFKTRDGCNIKLIDILDEVLKRATIVITDKNPKLPINKLRELANTIGIGAIKYAELSKNRTTDYIFDFDQMLSFVGNTAPYIQYTYTRALSVFKKADINKYLLFKSKLIISKNKELKLAIRLLQFEETLSVVAQNGTPHVMCSYLYNLSNLFSNFYESCSILNANNKILRNSRLKLVQLTIKTIKLGLNTLGIETTEYM